MTHTTIDEQARSLPSATAVRVALVEDSFRHEALFYDGADGFLRGALPFVADALDTGEPLLVSVGEQRAALLQDALLEESERVRFIDVHELARNPARVIGAWRDFLAEHVEDGRGVRVLGEPVWAGRSEAELDECARHESLLNVAFSRGQACRLLCPYDLDALAPSVIDAARRTHPALMHEGISRRNGAFLSFERAPGPFAGSLPQPPAGCEQLAFTRNAIGTIRRLIAQRSADAELGVEAGEDLVLAVNELVTNSVQYGGAGGTLRIWREREDTLVCEVRDRGFIRDPLVGRLQPPIDQHGGRGLWLVNQLCDLVQIRSAPSGTVVRVRMQRRAQRDWA
ncbi:MAG TPA: anti-sigma factor RsbA family regulatory protein [Solirubrobacteraceae bacterium]|nr:anti-sigma factor RsbA family regulatory protein [Solirubrobacteraceae bacterium]